MYCVHVITRKEIQSRRQKKKIVTKNTHTYLQKRQTVNISDL